MSKEFRYGVRFANTDLDGTLSVTYALVKIKGIGVRLADVIVKKADVDPETRLGFLSEAKIETLKDIVDNPSKYDIPVWLFNRSKDLETGENLHLIGSDLALQTKSDVDQMKKIKTWKGLRHSYGLKVRGQRTKTTGRRGRAVGVKKRTMRRS